MNLVSIFFTIVLLCVLIVSHEFGHFIVAKLNGIRVEEFSLGMGPKLLQWGKNETTYSLRAFPIGGYVKMTGEDDASNDPKAYCNKSVLQRMAVAFCGPFMNFVVAVLFFVIAFMYFGIPSTEPVIGTVQADGPAQISELQPGDRIINIDGDPIETWSDMTDHFREGTGQQLMLTVERAGETFTTEIEPVFNQNFDYGVIGITQSVTKANFFGSIKMGFVQTYRFTVLLVTSLIEMITGVIPVDVAGPVGMVEIVDGYVDIGLMYIFLLAGILSINLGVINLLPIPALDGSRLVFLAIEGIRRKPVPPDKEGMINFIGLLFMFALMILITVNDVNRLFGG